jgi:hypothetical protein
MPTVLRIEAYRFFFKVQSRRISTSSAAMILPKYWLDPVSLARSRGFRAHELNRLRALVTEHRVTFMEAWNVHFGG